MSLAQMRKVSEVVRKDSFNKKGSSPKIIRKVSQSAYEASPKDDRYSESWTSKSFQHSPTSVNVSSSYSDFSTSDFIHQCITNLHGGLGSPTRRSPLPKGSEDFRKVMEEIHADERAAQLADDNVEDAKLPIASRASPKISRTRNISGGVGGNKFTKHAHDTVVKLQMMKRMTRSLSSPTGSPRIVRKNAGQWSHMNMPVQLNRDTEEEGSNKSSAVNRENIFQFSSDSEEENVSATLSPRTSPPKRHPVTRKRSKKSSASNLFSDLTISG